MNTSALREEICRIGHSLFARGYTHGSTGNISAMTGDGMLIVTPTNVSLGELDPAQLSVIDLDGRVASGPQPTKEVPLHSAIYASRAAGAVVHLHSIHSVAVSTLPDIDHKDVFPPLTPYYLMRVGKTALLPYFRPGDPAIAQAILGLEGRYGAVLLANHGPVVAGHSLVEACNAIEELEQTAKLMLLLRNEAPVLVPKAGVEALLSSNGPNRK
jgi:3-dehydro-4-phosphotetronate decarboxylase